MTVSENEVDKMTAGTEEVKILRKGKEEIPKELIIDKFKPLYKSQDFAVWVTALVFFLILGAAMMAIGYARGWDADNGFTHNTSLTSKDRFLPEPFVDEPGVKGRYGTGASGRWYYWKLAPAEVTWLSRAVMWLCYLAHQMTVWILIYLAQRKQNESAAVVYQRGFRWFNWWLFGANVVFHLVHLGQTHWTYDALAQDVAVTSSQGSSSSIAVVGDVFSTTCEEDGSVVVMIGFICVLEYRDRGLLFGWPSQYHHDKISTLLRLPYSSMYVVRKYHGYGFAWAAVYTMWYHPMENTFGHLAGFFHTYILMVQASLIYTPLHLNKYWRFVLETWVAIHGTMVAVQTGGPAQMGTSLWPMFCFGFFMMVCITQVFTLPFWRRLPTWTRFLPLGVLLIVIVGMYSWIPDKQGQPWRRIYEPVLIPSILLLLPVLITGVIYLLLKIENCITSRRNHHEGESSKVSQIIFLILAVLMFCVNIFIGFCIQYFDLLIEVFITQIFVYVAFSLCICFEVMFMKQAFDRKNITRFVLETEEPRVEMEDNRKYREVEREKVT